MTTYKYGKQPNRIPLGEAEIVVPALLDTIAGFGTVTQLLAWLDHPRTTRYRERLQFSPDCRDHWQSLEAAIATAQDFFAPPVQAPAASVHAGPAASGDTDP